MKKPKKSKSKSRILKKANKMKPGFVSFDRETCMPTNTEGFTEEDWKKAIECSVLLSRSEAAAKSNRKVHIGIFLGAGSTVLVFWLWMLASWLWTMVGR